MNDNASQIVVMKTRAKGCVVAGASRGAHKKPEEEIIDIESPRKLWNIARSLERWDESVPCYHNRLERGAGLSERTVVLKSTQRLISHQNCRYEVS